MLSREADSLYWMSRNLERAETNARILNVQFLQMLEASEEETMANHDWEVIFDICASSDDFVAIRKACPQDEEALITWLTFSHENPNSLANCVGLARENARSIRNQLPDDLWEVWNDFYLDGRSIRGNGWSKKELHRYLTRMKMTALTARGILESSMFRGPAYWIIKIAKWLEQAEKTARILSVVSDYTHGAGTNGFQGESYYWRSALQFVSGYEAFLKQYPPSMEPNPVLTFLVTEAAFPKSIRYCINHIRRAVSELERGMVSHYSWQLYASLDTLLLDFDKVRIHELDRKELNVFLNQFQFQCKEIGKTFSRTYYLLQTHPNNGQLAYARYAGE
ncbi:alpha-E domain-containing protein [Gorillibacterium massiliense]|uniref:alpha-E domain-containing protein n=1 Tax=Gorillibacterium massiliense TaxID=1280390 RepID=UPI0004B71FB3|nr:alpha-E domain-containing protein [Gorillibacterium massiliense]